MEVKDILTIILSAIGATAWLAPWVFKKLSKPSLEGKLVSHFENIGEFNGKSCLLHFLAINLISLNGNFNIKDIQIFVKYKGSSNVYKGDLFWARFNKWKGLKNEDLELILQPEDTLPYVGTMPQDITKKIYLTFRVDKAELEEFEEIKIQFFNHSNVQSVVSIVHPSDGDQMLWDDRIWRKIK
jgi:hypothetical protein